MDKPKDYYRVLGVEPTASTAAIRRAYRRLAKQYHPESSAGASIEAFQQLQQAYETLTDAERRQRYDEQLQTTNRFAPLSWSFVRSSGAGGQHVNKTSTRVTLDVDLTQLNGPPAAVDRARRALPDGLRVSSQATRSQWRNRQECLSRAAQLLDDAARVTVERRASRPTRGSVERRLAAKRRDSDKKLGRRTTEW